MLGSKCAARRRKGGSTEQVLYAHPVFTTLNCSLVDMEFNGKDAENERQATQVLTGHT